MIPFLRGYSILMSAGFFTAVSLAHQANTSDVDQQVSALANPHTALKAQQKLFDLPSSEVIPAILNAIDVDTRFKEVNPRELAYQLLFHHECALVSRCRAVLIAGLADSSPSVQRIAAYGLVLTPDEARSDAIVALIKAMARNSDRPDVIKAFLRPLAKFGTDAVSAYDSVLEVLRTPGTSESLRSDAAYTLLAIGGLDRAFYDLLGHVPLQDRAVLWALRSIASESNGLWQATSKLRKEILHWVQGALADERSEIRRAALEALIAVYGKDISVKTAVTASLNPELKEVLTEVANSDPDLSIRNDAAIFLRDWAGR